MAYFRLYVGVAAHLILGFCNFDSHFPDLLLNSPLIPPNLQFGG